MIPSIETASQVPRVIQDNYKNEYAKDDLEQFTWYDSIGWEYENPCLVKTQKGIVRLKPNPSEPWGVWIDGPKSILWYKGIRYRISSKEALGITMTSLIVKKEKERTVRMSTEYPKSFYAEVVNWFLGKPASEKFYNEVKTWKPTGTIKCFRSVIADSTVKLGDSVNLGSRTVQSASLNKWASLYAGAQWAEQAAWTEKEKKRLGAREGFSRAIRYQGKSFVLTEVNARVIADQQKIMSLLQTAKAIGMSEANHGIKLLPIWQELWIAPNSVGKVVTIFDAHKFIDMGGYQKLSAKVKPK